ncbi:MAG: response regulator, partial [Spirochaetaceae bacterium]|nr:response regulator [Spirochaetaceae bacterium]
MGRKRHKNKKFLMGRIFTMTFFLPASIILFTSMEGPDMDQAFHNGLNLFRDPTSAPYIWSLLFLLNFCLYLYLKPVLIFNSRCIKKNSPGEKMQKIAAKKFNNLPVFILSISVIGFLLGFTIEAILKTHTEFNSVSLFWDFLDSLSTGLFTGTLMYLNTENLLFPVKTKVFSGDTILEQKYSSYYRKLFLTMFVIVLFLLFQMFSYFSSIYLLGADKAIGGVKPPLFDGGDFLNMSRENDPVKEFMKVFFVRVFIYFFYFMHLLRQLKHMIKNPLETVQEKLEGLNSDEPQFSKQIDIVNNDEFTQIYGEINKLIETQQRNLERSEEQLETIVDNAADPIISFHEDGKIHVFNPAAEKFFGYKKEEVFEKQMISLIDVPEAIKKQCQIDNGVFIEYISNFETPLKRFTGITKRGEKINFESNISQCETDHGTLFTTIIRDIRGQIEFEENLKKAKNSAENANRMKSEFLANMSHELRTPLNAVLGFTQLLSTDKNLTQGQLDKINTISRSGEHLLALINDILDISKIESGKTEMRDTIFDLNQFITDLKEMFILKCQTRGISLYVEYAGEIPRYVKGDLGKLRQIMINLIGNAVKFTNEGGVSLLVGREDGTVRFSINDTGKGIPEEEIEKILQPFMQSSNVDHEGGTGLGLAITNRFIEMMKGKLEISSEVGRGSTFSFEIPLEISEEAPVEEKNPGTVISIKGGKAVKALIVDDKVNNRLILKTMLENVGFITMEAENGLEAIERTKEFDPAIIFMDIKMPVMDGYESVRQIKDTAQGKKIVVFALTASAFKHDEKKIFDSGFDGFLPKPFKLGSLFRIVSENT